MKVCAPGKLILSGEHAVVHGAPALAVAINCHATVTITKRPLPDCQLHLADLAHHSHVTLQRLNHLKNRIKKTYQQFMRGEVPIHHVLHKPFELAQFVLSLLHEKSTYIFPSGANIKLQSQIPIGCGLGSSAATIISMLYAVSRYLQLTLSDKRLFQLALMAENMQHGHSSGLDLQVVIQGGSLYVEPNQTETRHFDMPPLLLAHTGTPNISTGTCVATVAPHFQHTTLTQTFGTITKAMDQALQQNNWPAVREAVRANHRLLVQIGVVPPIIQNFIREIEAIGGAAKICGAGAIQGDQAGVIWLLGPDPVALTQIAKRFHYPLHTMAHDTRGVHIA